MQNAWALRSPLYHRGMVSSSEPSDSFILRFSELSKASPARSRDAALRTFDVLLAAFFLIVTLPAPILIGGATLLAPGRPPRLRDVDGGEAGPRPGVDRRPLRAPVPAHARRDGVPGAAPVWARACQNLDLEPRVL